MQNRGQTRLSWGPGMRSSAAERRAYRQPTLKWQWTVRPSCCLHPRCHPSNRTVCSSAAPGEEVRRTCIRHYCTHSSQDLRHPSSKGGCRKPVLGVWSRPSPQYIQYNGPVLRLFRREVSAGSWNRKRDWAQCWPRVILTESGHGRSYDRKRDWNMQNWQSNRAFGHVTRRALAH